MELTTIFNDEFSFYVPFDIEKSEVTQNGEKQMIIGGYASTADKDRQDDAIVQRGIDFSEFLDFGYLNYNHDNSIIVGYPIKEGCKVDTHGFYVKARLLNGVQQAEDMYQAALALERANAPRRLGFSVEGKVLSRDKNGNITRCKIYNVAITNSPVNTNCTWDVLAKSMSSALSNYNPSVDCAVVPTEPVDYDSQNKEIVADDTSKVVVNATEQKIIAPETPQKEVSEKSLDTQSGSALIPESLDKPLKVTLYKDGKVTEDCQWFIDLSEILTKEEVLNQLIEQLSNKLTNVSIDEMTLYLQLTRGLSRLEAERLANLLNGSVNGNTELC